MNTFGRKFRVSIFGESHGPYTGITIDGCPPGISINNDDFTTDINRRKTGAKGTSKRLEDDIPIIISGVFNGYTTGAPITIIFGNKNIESDSYSDYKHLPRPGHADYTAKIKYKGYNDYRGSGHFSGRLTLPVVAAGVIAKKIIQPVNISAKITELYGNKNLNEAIKKAEELNDSIGGIIECKIKGLKAGYGEPFFDSLESLISHAIFAIPAIKGIEFGAGFKVSQMTGSENNDAIIDKNGTTSTNHAGGINGGISNGNEIIFRVAVKPASSTPKAQSSYNFETNKVESFSIKGRHDLCIALRVPVIVEAVTSIVIADLMIIDK
ncbi:MAG: chorismate synthase [Marinilabiliales bacterium]